MAQQTAMMQLIEWISSDCSPMDCVLKAKELLKIEKEQHESTCVNVIEGILDKLQKGENTSSEDVFNQYYNETYGNQLHYKMKPTKID